MLRIQIEIRSGNPNCKGTPIPIATLEADNVGGDEHYGDYDIRLWEHTRSGVTTKREAHLEGFARSKGAVALVKECIKALKI